MHRDGSAVPLRTLQRAIDGVKTFGGRLSLEQNENRRISEMMADRKPAKRGQVSGVIDREKNETYAKAKRRAGKADHVQERYDPTLPIFEPNEWIDVPLSPKTPFTVTIRLHYRSGPEWRSVFAIHGGGLDWIEEIDEDTGFNESRVGAIFFAARQASVHLYSQVLIVAGDQRRAAVRKAAKALEKFADDYGDMAANWHGEESVCQNAKCDKPIKAAPPNEPSNALALPKMLPATLVAEDKKKLAMCEQVIEKGRHFFLEVGCALKTIQIGRLYRETHATFEQYCEEKFDIGRQHAYRLIDATDVVKDLSPTGDTLSTKHGIQRVALPATESQARALVKIKDPEKRREAWGEVIKAAPLDESGEVKITAKLIEEQVAKVLGVEAKPKAISKPQPAAAKPTAKKSGKSDFEEDLDAIRHLVCAVSVQWTAKMHRDELRKLLRDLAMKLAR
jgi:hypothetical protein